MALSITEANAVQTQYFGKEIPQLVYEKDALFWMLKRKHNIAADGGNQLQFNVRYQKLSKARAVDAREQLSYESKTTRTAVTEDWKYYVASAVMNWDERVKNTGKPQIINLLADKAEELNQDMFDKFQTDLYATSQATKSFNALPATIIVSSGTLHGVSATDVAAWAANQDTSTTQLRLYGTASLSYMLNASTFGTDMPDLISTTRDLKSKAEALIQAAERFTMSDKDMADAGFDNIKFHGIPITGTAACPTGYMFLLDTDNLQFRYHPDWNFKTDDWSDLKQAGFPNALVRSMYWTGNLLCLSRQTQAKFTALDYTL